MTVPSIFESFNARNLAPRQVAKSFVPPDNFQTLVGQHHTLIVGPRGSGKTTLLKMLQPEALDAWDSAVGKKIREGISYNSVYVGTDISWSKQISGLGSNRFSPEQQSRFSIAAFTNQILKRLVECMYYLATNDSRFALTSRKEAFVCREIAKTLKLNEDVTSWLGLKYALGRRIVNIHSLASEERELDEEGRSSRLEQARYLHLSFIPCCSSAVDIFNDAIEQPHARWAFLFDELELAPKAIREYLLDSLRSVDERFLFKLSLVPFGEDVSTFRDVLSAMPGHDFEVIPLWYSHKEDGKSFCLELWKSMVLAKGLPELQPQDALGRSVFETDRSEWSDTGMAYGRDSRLAKRFENLAEKDKTFRDFLQVNEIDLKKLEELSSNQRSANIRKATSIVAVREAFIKNHDGASVTLRSRKRTNIYTGADSLFAITEGNPRWFKGIIGPLLEELSEEQRTVSETAQTNSIEKATRRFRAMLRTVPVHDDNLNKPSRGLLSLLTSIGEFFESELIIKAFSLDPPGAITIDSRVGDGTLASLGKAINTGAIVCTDTLETPWSSLRGKTFRLSYLLAHDYRLILRAGRNVSLSFALRNEGHNKLFTEVDDEEQS